MAKEEFNKLLVEKYFHQVYKETWTDETGYNGGVGGETALEDKESILEPEQPKTALSSQLVGLFDPATPEEIKHTDEALKELKTVLDKITKDIEIWQHKYTKLGATDTVSREQLFQYIAKSVFGLKRLDD